MDEPVRLAVGCASRRVSTLETEIVDSDMFVGGFWDRSTPSGGATVGRHAAE